MEIFNTETLPGIRRGMSAAPAITLYGGRIYFNKPAIRLLSLDKAETVSFVLVEGEMYILTGQPNGYPLLKMAGCCGFYNSRLVEKILSLPKKSTPPNVSHKILIAMQPTTFKSQLMGSALLINTMASIPKKTRKTG